MSKDVKVEYQNQNILAVSKVMTDNNIGWVFIVDNHESKNLVGIVTESDIIRLLIKDMDLLPSFANNNTNIAQKPQYNDFLRSYLDNTNPKTS